MGRARMIRASFIVRTIEFTYLIDNLHLPMYLPDCVLEQIGALAGLETELQLLRAAGN